MYETADKVPSIGSMPVRPVRDIPASAGVRIQHHAHPSQPEGTQVEQGQSVNRERILQGYQAKQ